MVSPSHSASGARRERRRRRTHRRRLQRFTARWCRPEDVRDSERLQCPACASAYRGDARHLVRAGLEGGKGVDESVASHPAVFLTLAAPGFGLVHGLRNGSQRHPSHVSGPQCRHGRPLVCRAQHQNADVAVGTPLRPDCYDYVGAVLHNASTSELWRRTTIYIQRQLAAVLRCSQAVAARTVRLASCRVAEFQCRGVVHLHAVVRADGPDGSAPRIDPAHL
ncbi:MAG TPA: replication initiator, partial [Acidimicrobiales bacterium]|nr:replication initiator [Acidimicrobiales bacterium]